MGNIPQTRFFKNNYFGVCLQTRIFKDYSWGNINTCKFFKNIFGEIFTHADFLSKKIVEGVFTNKNLKIFFEGLFKNLELRYIF